VPDFLVSPVRETAHRGDDDLLTAGLGLAGLRGAPSAFTEANAPTPEELRRRAIQGSWKGIADLGPLGNYGTLYGSTARVSGREFQAFAKLPHARSPHRVLLQVPDAFDAAARCLIVTASSGSRGIYGAIALAGAWGLPRGCAVAYTDKGNGSGYFDAADGSGVALDGTRTQDPAAMEFHPGDGVVTDAGIATKHAHSGDNPEADWAQCVLQAAHFGLAMLDRAFPQLAPFTPHNTRIIAVGISNGAGAVLQAAGVDAQRVLGGVVALAPNVNANENSRALYDYNTEAGLLLPCALTDAAFDAVPFARVQGRVPPPWSARGAALAERGLLHATAPAAQGAEARERLRASGWSDAALASAASSTAFDIWRSIGATYAASYLRSRVGEMPCGYRFSVHDASGKPRPATPAERAAWWADGSGIPPGAGVTLDGSDAGDTADADLRGLLCLRALWTEDNPQAKTLRDSVDATRVQLPPKELPLWVIHGSEDGLLPKAFTSEPYVAWLRQNGRAPRYWPIAHAQHFDAFLAFPGFGDRYVPLLPYGYAALDALYAHMVHGRALPDASAPGPAAAMRGPVALGAAQLGLALA